MQDLSFKCEVKLQCVKGLLRLLSFSFKGAINISKRVWAMPCLLDRHMDVAFVSCRISRIVLIVRKKSVFSSAVTLCEGNPGIHHPSGSKSVKHIPAVFKKYSYISSAYWRSDYFSSSDLLFNLKVIMFRKVIPYLINFIHLWWNYMRIYDVFWVWLSFSTRFVIGIHFRLLHTHYEGIWFCHYFKGSKV